VVSCEGKVRSITIDPELLASEGLELCLDARGRGGELGRLEAADKLVDGEIAKVTGGVKLPGM
jgi:DNA-binding protein YbaB